MGYNNTLELIFPSLDASYNIILDPANNNIDTKVNVHSPVELAKMCYGFRNTWYTDISDLINPEKLLHDFQ